MRELVSEIFLFIYSTLTHWQALVSGGILTALVVILERVSGYRLNRKTFIGLFVGVFLLVAFFLGWREERAGRLRQEAEINKMLANKPRLKGNVEFFNIGTSPNAPAHMAIAMVISISNIGSISSIADSWQCQLQMESPQGADFVQGEVRGFPEGLTIPRGPNKPMVFGRDDALYVKTMRTPIVPGAKAVGAMICIFPKANLQNFMSSTNNTLVIGFRDVLGEQHEVAVRYLNQPGMDYNNRRGEWVDIPGMEHPPTAPSPQK